MIDDPTVRAMHPKVWNAVEANGEEWTPAPRPKNIRKRADKACFLNAARVAIERPEFNLSYCEGLALTESGWVHHAWCVTSDRTVVDVTWRAPGERYVGFTVDSVELCNLMLDNTDPRGWGGVVDAR